MMEMVFVIERNPEEKPLWDSFRAASKEKQSISMADTKFIDYSITLMKLTAYALTFCGVLCGGVLSKAIILLMTSQLAPEKTVTLKRGESFITTSVSTLFLCAVKRGRAHLPSSPPPMNTNHTLIDLANSFTDGSMPLFSFFDYILIFHILIFPYINIPG